MAFLADKVPHSVDVGLDLKVLVFTVLVSVCTGIIAGILPALHLSRANVNEALKQGLGRTDTDSGGNRTRNVLVVVEVSLSLILLVGAGLLIRSFKVLREVNPGFESSGVLTQTVAVSRSKFSNIRQEVAFFDRVLENVRTLPSVVAAGLLINVPIGDGGSLDRSPWRATHAADVGATRGRCSRHGRIRGFAAHSASERQDFQ